MKIDGARFREILSCLLLLRREAAEAPRTWSVASIGMRLGSAPEEVTEG